MIGEATAEVVLASPAAPTGAADVLATGSAAAVPSNAVEELATGSALMLPSPDSNPARSVYNSSSDSISDGSIHSLSGDATESTMEGDGIKIDV